MPSSRRPRRSHVGKTRVAAVVGSACLLLCLVLVIAARSEASDENRAARGETDGTAPVQASAQVAVNAPAERVWSALTDVGEWPTWQADIQRTLSESALSVGARFDWSSGSGTIHSRIALLEPERRLAWTGHLYWFHAIHVWALTALPDGRTLVRTEESMSGWPIGLLFPSADLLDADRRWLDFLRKKAERTVHS